MPAQFTLHVSKQLYLNVWVSLTCANLCPLPHGIEFNGRIQADIDIGVMTHQSASPMQSFMRNKLTASLGRVISWFNLV